MKSRFFLAEELKSCCCHFRSWWHWGRNRFALDFLPILEEESSCCEASGVTGGRVICFIPEPVQSFLHTLWERRMLTPCREWDGGWSQKLAWRPLGNSCHLRVTMRNAQEEGEGTWEYFKKQVYRQLHAAYRLREGNYPLRAQTLDPVTFR